MADVSVEGAGVLVLAATGCFGRRERCTRRAGCLALCTGAASASAVAFAVDGRRVRSLLALLGWCLEEASARRDFVRPEEAKEKPHWKAEDGAGRGAVVGPAVGGLEGAGLGAGRVVGPAVGRLDGTGLGKRR